MTTIPFRILLSACGLLLLSHLTLAAGPSLLSIELSHDLQIRGLKIPLGQQESSKPTVSLFFGEISVEPMRLGFLRIGLIPQPVASGMRVAILEPQGGAAWAADFARFAAGEPALERMDIRGIEFHSSIKDVVSVRADKARFVAADRTLRLQTGEVRAEGQPVHPFIEGEVHLEGAKAGQLEWQEGGRTHCVSLNGPPSALGGEVRLLKPLNSLLKYRRCIGGQPSSLTRLAGILPANLVMMSIGGLEARLPSQAGRLTLEFGFSQVGSLTPDPPQIFQQSVNDRSAPPLLAQP